MPRFALLACSLFLVVAPLFAQSVSTPVQAAFLKAETRKIDDHYLQRLADISSVPIADVKAAIPLEGRLTDEVARSVAALEKLRGEPMSAAQKQSVASAEKERRNALAAARSAAARK
jgi:hypothetical protein